MPIKRALISQIGTKDEPYENRVILTLHGHPRDKELPLFGTKGIFVRDGIFEAHGKKYIEVELTAFCTLL